MRVACIQMCSGDDVAANLAVVAHLLERPADEDVCLAALPENFSFMHPDEESKRSVAADVVPSTVLPLLSRQAALNGMFLVGGSVLLEGEGSKLRSA